MAETNKYVTFVCPHDLAEQIEKKCAEFDGRYTLNIHNMEMFSKVYDLFYSIADEDGGDVTCLDIDPGSASAYVSIEVSLLDLYKDTMKKFVEVLQYVNTFDVKPTSEDSLIIGASVDCVWEASE